MSTPNRTGVAGFCDSARLAALPTTGAAKARDAAPRVFTNVRRSAGMSSSVGMGIPVNEPMIYSNPL